MTLVFYHSIVLLSRSAIVLCMVVLYISCRLSLHFVFRIKDGFVSLSQLAQVTWER